MWHLHGPRELAITMWEHTMATVQKGFGTRLFIMNGQDDCGTPEYMELGFRPRTVMTHVSQAYVLSESTLLNNVWEDESWKSAANALVFNSIDREYATDRCYNNRHPYNAKTVH